MVNPPTGYKPQDEIALSNFSHPLPHVVGYQKFHMLAQPIHIILNDINPLRCYVVGKPTMMLTIWSMRSEDVDKINSITYDLVRKRRLFGHVNYLNGVDYNAFQFDRFTEMYYPNGSAIPWPVATQWKIEDITARVVLKVEGLCEDMCHHRIEPIINVFHLKTEFGFTSSLPNDDIDRCARDDDLVEPLYIY